MYSVKLKRKPSGNLLSSTTITLPQPYILLPYDHHRHHACYHCHHYHHLRFRFISCRFQVTFTQYSIILWYIHVILAEESTVIWHTNRQETNKINYHHPQILLLFHLLSKTPKNKTCKMITSLVILCIVNCLLIWRLLVSMGWCKIINSLFVLDTWCLLLGQWNLVKF
jgi:hypothetical protein